MNKDYLSQIYLNSENANFPKHFMHDMIFCFVQRRGQYFGVSRGRMLRPRTMLWGEGQGILVSVSATSTEGVVDHHELNVANKHSWLVILRQKCPNHR